MLWAVNESDSLFVYPHGRNHSDYQNLTFRPRFERVRPDELSENATKVCRGNAQCEYDFVVTGNNLAFARSTIALLDKVNETKSNLSVQVSCFIKQHCNTDEQNL